ncbi:MAG: HAD family hydrolase [Thermomicrobiales bacterium]
MSRGAITFDFHDTIACCDAWFDLEVHHLLSAFFAWRERKTGTAVESSIATAADAAYRRFRTAIHRHGHELPATRSVIVVMESLGMSINPDEVDLGVEEIMRVAFECVSPDEGAIETFHELAAVGIPLGIVSSAAYHPFLPWTLERFGLNRTFRAVTTSASAGFYRSRPEIFWQTLNLLGAEPRLSAHIGDSLRFDVGGARRAGLRTAWYNSRVAPSDGSRPDLTVTSMRGVAPQLLDLLNGHRR